MNLDDFIPGSKMKRDAPIAVKAKDVDGWDSKPIMKKLGGVDVPMYTIGSLATAVDKSVQTIRSWISNGYLPDSIYRLPAKTLPSGVVRKNRRLYTREMIQSLVDILAKRNLLGSARIEWSEYPDIKTEIVLSWNDLATVTNAKRN